MKLTKELVKEKLDNWFGIPYEIEVLKQSDDTFVVLAVAEGFESYTREVVIIRIFTIGDKIEISEDFSYTVTLNRDSSIAACIGDSIKAYMCIDKY